MKTLPIIVIISMLLVGPAFALSDDNNSPGPNSLSGNPDINVLKMDSRNVPEFVIGKLLQKAQAGEEMAASLEFFEKNRGAYRMINPDEELFFKRIDVDSLGFRHVRMEQKYKGLKVIGGEQITHFNADGILKAVNGNYIPDIDLNVTPALSELEAMAISKNDLASFFGDGRPGPAELVIFPWEDKHFLAWRLFLYSDTPMGRWEYFIDAISADIIYKANRIYNANDIGIGIGVMGDTVYHVDTHNNGTDYIMTDYTRRLTNNPHEHNGQMPSSSYLQTNIAGSTLPGIVASDDDNNWFDASQIPAVSAHTYSALVYDWFLSFFNRNSYNDGGASMLTIVNYSGEGNNNAYWDGNRIVIWSYSTGWRSLSGCPDVIAHEWGHAVTEYSSNLVYEKESGALNESFSDMMGAAFEFAHDSMDIPDWLMGENGRTTGVPFRSMSDPHAFNDPDYYGSSDPYWINVINCTPSDQNDYCGVHTNSGVGNKWFYLLSNGGTHHNITVAGIGVENAMKIAYRANSFYWTVTTDYHNAAIGTISAADDLDSTGFWTSQVALAWNAVGVSTPTPSLVFDYPSGKPSSIFPNQQFSMTVILSGSMGGSPVAGSGTMYYSVNDNPYILGNMIETFPNNYTIILPAVNCNDELKYFIMAQESSGTIFFDPPDSANPERVEIATAINTIFEDNYEADKEWIVTGTASAGHWQRGMPAGGGSRGDAPIDYDGSGQCYLTGNATGDSDVDGGTTILTSPAFDLNNQDAIIHYGRWYSNNYGNAPFTDTFKVFLSNNNGASWTLVENVGPIEQSAGNWYEHSFWVSSYVVPSDQMRLRFEAEDQGDGSVVEAAVDDITVTIFECIPPFICGDANGDEKVNLLDVSFIISALYRGGPQPNPIQSADVNHDTKMNLLDVSYIISFLYRQGPVPNCP